MGVRQVRFRGDCFGLRGFDGAAGATEQIGFPGRIETQVVEVDRAECIARQMGVQQRRIARYCGNSALTFLGQARAGLFQARLRRPDIRAVHQRTFDQSGELGVTQIRPPGSDRRCRGDSILRRPIE